MLEHNLCLSLSAPGSFTQHTIVICNNQTQIPYQYFLYEYAFCVSIAFSRTTLLLVQWGKCSVEYTNLHLTPMISFLIVCIWCRMESSLPARFSCSRCLDLSSSITLISFCFIMFIVWKTRSICCFNYKHRLRNFVIMVKSRWLDPYFWIMNPKAHILCSMPYYYARFV